MTNHERSTPNLWLYAKPVADAALVVVGFVLAYWVRYRLQWIRAVEPASFVRLDAYLPSVVVLTGITACSLWLDGAYRPDRARTLADEFYAALKAVLTGIAAITIIVFYARPWYYSRLIFGYTGVLSLLLLWAARAVEASVIARRRRRGVGVTRLLLVGADENARTIMRAVVARPDLGYRIVGFVDDDPVKASTDIGRYPALGSTEQLPELIRAHEVDEVIITLPWMSHRKILEIMGQCEQDQVRTRIVPDLFQMTLHNVVVENIDGVPLLGVAEPRLRHWQHIYKRAFDIVVASLLLILLMPAFLVVALLIMIDSRGPVLFRQRRMGRHGREFMCIKFRTMCENAEQMLSALADRNEATGPLFKMRDDPRRTRIGRLLRNGFDELPQLWNVLKGEMSLVGPRPAIPAEVAAYEPWQRRRLDVRPGATGLWQVSGRSDVTFDEMVLLDLYYIENWSPILDIRILLKTIPVILVGSGGY